MIRILASACAVLTLAASPAFAQAKATITGVRETLKAKGIDRPRE